MKTKLKSIMIVMFLVLILISILGNPNETISSVLFGINIWMYNVFPSLFPFFIMSDLLINYGFIEFISELFKGFMKFFGLSGNCSFPLFGSMVSGFPSGAKYTKQLLDNNLITEDESNHLIMFTHFSNPLFIIGTIGAVLLNSIYLGYLILISHILGNFIIGFLFRDKKYGYNDKSSLKKAIYLMNKKRISNKDNFITILSNSIYNTIDILILLLGTIIVFLLVSNLINIIPLNSYFLMIVKGILEMTQGVKLVSTSNLVLSYKLLLITLFISFGGFSVHLQVSSVINGSKIKYKNFLIARILHSIISMFLVYVLFIIFFN